MVAKILASNFIKNSINYHKIHYYLKYKDIENYYKFNNLELNNLAERI